MKTWKLVSGILSLVFSAIVLYQSWAASILDQLANVFLDVSSNSGAAGVIVAALMIAGGIVSIITRRGQRAGDISLVILYGLAALVGYTSFGIYKDLVIWSTWCLICAILAVVSLVKIKNSYTRQPVQVQPTFHLKSEDLVTADGMMEYCRYFNTFNGASEEDSRRLFEKASQVVTPDPQVTMAFMARTSDGESCACVLANSKFISASDHDLNIYPITSITTVSSQNDTLVIQHDGGELQLIVGQQMAAGLAAGLEKSLAECRAELNESSYGKENSGNAEAGGPVKKSTLWKHRWAGALAVILIVMVVIAVFPKNQDSDETEDLPQGQDQTSASGVADSSATVGEQNALSQANSYLSVSSFSASGLIEQLEFEGYTTEEAEYAIANCGADWNEQALGKARSYLDMSGFSYSGLHEQLTFEGFLPTEVQYAVDNCGADWNQEAAEAAASYMDITSFSRERLIDQLLFVGFTQDQAEYGAEQVGY